MLRRVLRKIHIPAGLRPRVPILCRKFLFERFKVGVLPNQHEWNFEFDILEEPNHCGIELYPNCDINDIIYLILNIGIIVWTSDGRQEEPF